MTPSYTPSEMMIVAASRALEGIRTVFVGVGMPNIACNLAQLTVAPNLELVYESGIYGARPARLPLSVGDPTLVSGSIAAVSAAELFGLYLQGGRIDVAFLGAAQVDRFGNLNSTVIGEYHLPRVRLPGSGGAAEIAISAGRIFVMIPLSARSFVQKLDFVTSPGHLAGTGSRQALGMRGRGPELVVTDFAMFDFGNDATEMQLDSVYPGASVEQIRASVGWDLRIRPHLNSIDPPSNVELRVLRTALDRLGSRAAD